MTAANRKRSSIWIVVLTGLWALAAGVAAVTRYFIPKSVGDSFAENLLTLDIAALEATLCDETSLGDIRRDLVQVGGAIPEIVGDGLLLFRAARRALDDAMHVKSRYNVLTGDYTFQYVLDQQVSIGGFRAEAGYTTPEIVLDIRPLFGDAHIEGI